MARDLAASITIAMVAQVLGRLFAHYIRIRGALRLLRANDLPVRRLDPAHARRSGGFKVAAAVFVMITARQFRARRNAAARSPSSTHDIFAAIAASS